MLWKLSQVAIGGAIGASARYLVGVAIARGYSGGFPLGVITVNILGSFLIGVFVVMAERKGLTHLAPLLVTGVLGGFTTFSSFSLETLALWERGATVQAATYVLLSVALSLAGIVAGLSIARSTFA